MHIFSPTSIPKQVWDALRKQLAGVGASREDGALTQPSFLPQVCGRDPGVVRWHLTAHAADAVVHTSTCIAGSQLCMHYL